jgi:molybdopterin converting factor subunit 1
VRRVEVRYFASLAERTGCASELVGIEDGTDVERLWAELVARHPALRSIGYRPLVACDRSYVDWKHELSDVREIAFLPPVSGG